jgi:hypothetical protein
VEVDREMTISQTVWFAIVFFSFLFPFMIEGRIGIGNGDYLCMYCMYT